MSELDGILMKKFNFEDNKVFGEFDLIPDKTKIIIKARDPPDKYLEIIMNNKSFGKFDKKTLENGFTFTVEA